MSRTNLDRATVIEEYVNREKSANQIAKEYNTYPNEIYRLLKKYGIPKRGQSESLALSHKQGKREAPFKNGMPDHIKNKIGVTAESKWTPERKEKQAEFMAEKWKHVSAKDKQEQLDKLQKGLRLASKAGSRLEKSLEIFLVKKGYTCVPHCNLLQNDKLEVDLYLPELKTVIEINGPSHYSPIWGEDAMLAQQKADANKKALLIGSGFRLIVIKMMDKVSRTKLNRLFGQMDAALTGFDKYQEIEL